ncbi:MAG TPA: chromosome partitioning protein ParA, partial [Pseudomonas sp.]|nr:chromosome partitioning protein ParA [Pseudomonas sp.]
MNKAVATHASRFQLPKLAAIALGGLLLTACAGNPPTEQFAVTESAVRSA